MPETNQERDSNIETALINYPSQVDYSDGDEFLYTDDVGYQPTKLIYSILLGDIRSFWNYLIAGANLNKTDNKGNTPLMRLIENGYVPECIWLLEHYSSRELPDSKRIDVNKLNNEGISPLVNAISDIGLRFYRGEDKANSQTYTRAQWHELVKALLNHPECDVNAGGKHNFTPLIAASAHNLTQEVELLLSFKDVDPKIKYKSLKQLKNSATGEIVEEPNPKHPWHGSTAMHIAAVEDSSESLRIFLDNQIQEINATTEPSRLNILHLAITHDSDKTVDTILEYAGDTPEDLEEGFNNSNILSMCNNHLRYTPLLLSTIKNKPEITNKLLKFEIVRDSAKFASQNNKLPIYEALEKNDFENFEFMLTNTDSVQVDSKVTTVGKKLLSLENIPSMLVDKMKRGYISDDKLKQNYISAYPGFFKQAIIAGKFWDLMHRMQDIGACRDASGETILHASVISKDVFVMCLIKVKNEEGLNPADILNLKDCFGQNVLHHAITNCTPATVQRILMEGGDPLDIDNNGYNSLFKAVEAMQDSAEGKNVWHYMIDILTGSNPGLINEKVIAQNNMGILHFASFLGFGKFIGEEFHRHLLSKKPTLEKDKTDSGIEPLTVLFATLKQSQSHDKYYNFEDVVKLHISEQFSWKGEIYKKPSANIFVKTKKGENLVEAALGSGHEEAIMPLMQHFYSFKNVSEVLEKHMEEKEKSTIKQVYNEYKAAFDDLVNIVGPDINFEVPRYRQLLHEKEVQEKLRGDMLSAEFTAEFSNYLGGLSGENTANAVGEELG